MNKAISFLNEELYNLEIDITYLKYDYQELVDLLCELYRIAGITQAKIKPFNDETDINNDDLDYIVEVTLQKIKEIMEIVKEKKKDIEYNDTLRNAYVKSLSILKERY